MLQTIVEVRRRRHDCRPPALAQLRIAALFDAPVLRRLGEGGIENGDAQSRIGSGNFVVAHVLCSCPAHIIDAEPGSQTVSFLGSASSLGYLLVRGAFAACAALFFHVQQIVDENERADFEVARCSRGRGTAAGRGAP